MNRLVTAALEKGDITKLIEFPKDILYESEIRIINFILDYSSKYYEPPTIKRLQEEFPSFIPFFFEELPPIGDIYDKALQEKLNEYVLGELAEARASIYDNGELDTLYIQNIMKAISTSSGIERYSTFDRSTYFRTKMIDFGIKTINRATGGIANGDYALVIGRLGTGKTTLTIWLANQWRLAGKLVLFVSNEMLTSDVFGRVDGMEGTFNPLVLRSGRSKDIDSILKMVSVRARKERGDIIIPKKRLATPEEVFALAKDLMVDVIIIDGVYLMSMTGKYGAKWEKISEISNSLKQGAITTHIPCVGVTQMKRDSSKKDEMDPEDIAYSDALGQDADFIIAIRPLSEMIGHRIESQLIKNRFGPRVACQISIDYDKMIVHEDSIYGEYEYDIEKSTSHTLAGDSWEVHMKKHSEEIEEIDEEIAKELESTDLGIFA